MKTRSLLEFNCFQPTSYMKYFYVVLFFTLVLATGCIKSELPSAFDGVFDGKKNNKVISEYCTSCHIHKSFNSNQHVSNMSPKYKRRLFRKTIECRVCHFIESKWVHNGVLRKTRRPQEVNRGGFRKFEKEYKKSGRKKPQYN